MARRHRAAETGEGRNVVHVPLTPEANRVVNLWCDRTGSTKTKMVARLLEWFAGSPESMQQVVVGAVPRDLADEYAKRAAEFFTDYTRRVAGGEGAGGIDLSALTPAPEAGVIRGGRFVPTVRARKAGRSTQQPQAAE